jgi:hypothetical protein
LGALGGEGPAAAQASEAADVAAAAEQHRLTNAAASVDLRSLAVALERGLPYAALLLLLFISTHMVGIAVFAYLSWVLHRVNRLVRAQVALKAERSAHTLLALAAAVAAHVPLVLLALRGQDIAGNLVLAGTARPTQLSDTVFAVVVGDTTLRFVAVLAKIAILLAAPADSTVHVRRRGHLLTCAEFVSQLYRMLPPAPLWYAFYAAQAAVPALLRTGLSGAYLLIKAQHFFERAALVALAVQQCAQRSYGSTPSAEERQEAGNCCPICQDAYREPTKLTCGHIFCNDCLSEWFERERTCPMCRAAVGPASKKFKSFSDGRTPIFPFLF